MLIVDIFWSVAAWAYDLEKLKTISPLLWPFVAVCPVFPLLIALVLLPLYRKKKPNQFLLSLAAIPSAIYGLVALIFYPIAMVFQGFSWNAVGQIFWVMVYALQGFWLISKITSKKAFYFGLGFIGLQIIVIDIAFNSFGYFDFEGISKLILISIAVLAFLFFSIILEFMVKKR